MADNVAVTPGSGAVMAADDVGGVLFQRVKIAHGADGAATDASAAAPLPVSLTLLEVAEDAAHVGGERGLMMLAVRRDTPGSLVGTDGDFAPLQVNSQGRLRVAVAAAMGTATTGNITANGQSVSCSVDEWSNVVFTISGTYGSVAIAFEGSIDGGTTWFTIQAVRSDANTIETASGTISNTNRMWEASVNGLTHFRVRSTAYTSGTAAIRIVPAPFATEPIPAAQVSGTQPVSGTVSAGLNAGTNTIGQVRLAADTGQGSSTAHRTAFVANITTGAPTLIKNGATALGSFTVANNCGAGVWVHLYNLTAAPTLGTSVPEASFFVPAGTTFVLDCGPFANRFATGLSYAITDNCAATPVAGGTITIASTAAAICVSARYT